MSSKPPDAEVPPETRGPAMRDRHKTHSRTGVAPQARFERASPDAPTATRTHRSSLKSGRANGCRRDGLVSAIELGNMLGAVGDRRAS